MLILKEYNPNTRIERAWYESSNVLYSECYDKKDELKELKVVFKQKDGSTATYLYKDVNVNDYLMFRSSDSSGKGLIKYISGKQKGYAYEKLAESESAERIKWNLDSVMNDSTLFANAYVEDAYANGYDSRLWETKSLEVKQMLIEAMPKSMKVLFLDVDGVLNSNDFYEKRHEDGKYKDGETAFCANIDPECIARVNRIIEATGCKVVLTSSWRSDFKIKDKFNEIGLDIYDKTTVDTMFLKREVTRGEEVDMWLKENNCSNYVIIDDSSDFSYEQIEGHMVKTEEFHGLTDEHVEKAIKILNEGKK